MGQRWGTTGDGSCGLPSWWARGTVPLVPPNTPHTTNQPFPERHMNILYLSPYVPDPGASHAGGLIGSYASTGGEIENCYSTCSVETYTVSRITLVTTSGTTIVSWTIWVS